MKSVQQHPNASAVTVIGAAVTLVVGILQAFGYEVTPAVASAAVTLASAVALALKGPKK